MADVKSHKDVAATRPTNRHPVDELHDLRAQIAAMLAYEKFLRNLIITASCEPRGDAWMADISSYERVSLDVSGVRDRYGDDELGSLIRRNLVTMIRLWSVTK